MQIYMAREDESEESEPYRGSQCSLEGEEVGFENESQEEEGVWMICTELRNLKKASKK